MCSVSLFLPPCARTDPSFNGSQRISAASRKGRLGCKHATPPHRNFCEQRAHHDTQRGPAGVVVHTRRRRLGFQTSLLLPTAKGGVQAICNRITITPPLCSNSRVPSNPSRQHSMCVVDAALLAAPSDHPSQGRALPWRSLNSIYDPTSTPENSQTWLRS